MNSTQLLLAFGQLFLAFGLAKVFGWFTILSGGSARSSFESTSEDHTN